MASLALGLCVLTEAVANGAAIAQWEVFETSWETKKAYANPFTDIEVNGVFQQSAKQWIVPAFWAGGGKWTVRFAPPTQGEYRFHVECTDKANPDLNGSEQTLRVSEYKGHNRLLKHGFLRVSADKRHFEHADGTPFLWLGDTWWKNLCKRMTWEGFQELTANRKAKGFNVVLIVCGPFPDEGMFEPRWENEGGKPYENRDFTLVNPAYFDYADRRIKHLVDQEIVPAIVGGWGRDWGMAAVGEAGYKRHWRNLIARYGAYPTVWLFGGEAGGWAFKGVEKQWTEVARYVKKTDPYGHLATMHATGSSRTGVTDESVLHFDMLQTSHAHWDAARETIPKLVESYSMKPPMPTMVGEACYEGHMQFNYQDVQRYLFWACMLSGAAGHTYGAAGVWHAGVEGNPGTTPIYDWTTWKEGMNFPGSTQLGLGKKLLEEYPWWRFEPHSEWAEPDSFAAGTPGEVRFIYQPRRGVYNWNGTIVKRIERDVPYHAFYFNPGNAKKYDLGTFINAGPPPKPFEGHTQPLLFADQFDGADGSAWKDYGTPSQRKDGLLVGTKGTLTILEKINETNLMASVEARSDAEAGIILRFHSPDNYLVALYTPSLKAIYIHDRKNGGWGDQLGRVDVPEIGPKIRLTAATCGDYAALVLTDGTKSYYTPMVKVSNVTSGPAGLWLYQIGDRQEFGNFELSRAQFGPVQRGPIGQAHALLWSDEYKAPGLPSPQDWVLVLERVKL